MSYNNLSNIQFKSDYDSYEQDIVEEFYVPALSHATHYDRVSAYFDSKILALYSKGIKNIAENGGKIRFVFSHQLNEEDFNQMEKGYSEREAANLLGEFDTSQLDEDELKRLSDLSFLIAKGIVDIKIAFTREGLNHDKFGLIYDDDSNYVYFRGSNNETLAAVYRNHEIFEVSCSMWNEQHENNKIQKSISTFENIWNNQVIGRNVIEIPSVIREQLDLISKQYGNSENFDNCIILDYFARELVMIDNMNEGDITKNFNYKSFIKSHIRLNEENKYTFYHESYSLVIKRIEKIEKMASAFNSEVKLTTRLKNYLERRKSYLMAKANIGVAIKLNDFSYVGEYSSQLEKLFEKYKSILNRDMERKLRYRQLIDSFHIACLESAANFSVPGAGKTSIVYGAYTYLSSPEVNKVNKIVMIGPISSFKSWKDEFVANFGQKRKMIVLDIQDKKYGNSKRRDTAIRTESGSCNLILVNYDSLSTLKGALKEIINEKTMLVFDEIHKIKAVEGVAASAALELADFARYKVALTGTPIPNSFQDIFNLFEIILGEDRRDYIKYNIQELKNPSPIKVKEINEKMFPFFCRTTKRDLEIPEANADMMVKCGVTQNEEKLYRMISKKFRSNGLEKYIRLLQASTNPSLLLKSIENDEINSLISYEDISEFEEDYSKKFYSEPKFEPEEIEIINSVKVASKFMAGIDKVMELVNEGKQVLVWGIFVDTIDKIKATLMNNGVRTAVICGYVNPTDREEIIEDFKSKKVQVLIANPHTMAESVSLHKNCHDAVYFEYSFNLTHMLQSRDRINRLGLPEGQYTQYYYLVQDCEDYFLDLRTYSRLKEKEKVMLSSIENKDLELVSFSVDDDMKAIFSEIQ